MYTKGIILSIVIPIYNRLTYVKKCIESVLSQKQSLGGKIEIIFIDDASANDPFPIIRKMLNDITQNKKKLYNDNEFIILFNRQNVNVGEYRNVNTGIQLSSGKWKFILHDDDYVLENFFETIYKYINSNDKTDKIGYICFGYKNIDNKANILYEKNDISNEGVWPKNFSNQLFLKSNPMHVHCMLFYHKLFDTIGYFDSELKYYNDMEFFIRSILTPLQWLYIPKTCVIYRIHSESTQSMERDSELGKKYKIMLQQKIQKYIQQVDKKYTPLKQLITAKKFIEALQLAKTLLNDSMNDIIFWKMLSFIQLNIKNYEDCINSNKKALGLIMKQYSSNPKLSLIKYDYEYMIAESLKYLGKKTDAVQIYRRLVLLKDNYSVSRALYYLDDKNRLENITKCVQLKPDDCVSILNWASTLNPWEERIIIKNKVLEAFKIIQKINDKTLQKTNFYNNKTKKYIDNMISDATLWENNRYIIFLIKFATLCNIHGYIPHIILILKVIYNDKKEIIKDRLTFDKNLELLIKYTTPNCIPTAKIIPAFRYSSYGYYLAYHNMSNKYLLAKLSSYFRHICHGLNYIAPHTLSPKKTKKKLKVLYLSTYITSLHSVFKDRSGIMIGSQTKFDVHYSQFITKPGTDIILQHYKQNVKNPPLLLPDNIEECKKIIAAQQFDIIIYCEIGMDIRTYFLAHMRLAPIQCSTWGHSDTSGISTIDYFISSKYFETDVAQKNYSEKLICLNSLSTFYSIIFRLCKEKSLLLKRIDFNLPSIANIYLCTQSVFKFHPVFDDVIKEILAKDDKAIIVLLNFGFPYKHLLKRLEKNLGKYICRIHVFEQMKYKRFLNLLNISDVILDLYPFGGCNTSLEGFFVDKPIVTLPSKMINGRFTYGFYKKMEMDDLIAKDLNDYVQLALRLTSDKKFYNKMVAKIKNRIKTKQVFSEPESITTWNDTLQKLYDELL
jgi:predicted O-linked N-acetylglucosamine transferase (SPINDLY family)/GT2 family glycosyltransferase